MLIDGESPTVGASCYLILVRREGIMAAKNRKSVLGDAYGDDRQSVAKIAADTSLPMSGFNDPPPNIKNGRAQLLEVKFATFGKGEHEGKPYFSGAGIILEPKTHVYVPTSKGVTVEGAEPIVVETAGMQTRISPIGVHDIIPKSGKSMGQLIPWTVGLEKAAQHMRALGADTSHCQTPADFEELAEELTKAAQDPDTPIYFAFSTSVRKAQNEGELDGVWQNWHGIKGLENYIPPESGVGVGTQDNTAPVSTRSAAQPAKGPPSKGTSTATAVADDDGEDDISGMDLDALLELAKQEEGDETPAQDELLNRASAATGKEIEQIQEEVDSWEAVVAMINGEDNDTVGTSAPTKGTHYNYKPMTKGIGGKMVKSKKSVECVVVTVNEKDSTVTLKSTVDGKTLYKDVSWDALEDM